MAVYTPVSPEQLAALADTLGLVLSGTPEGVADGTENTTYFFEAGGSSGEAPRRYVLTILESCTGEQAGFSAALTRLLGDAGLPVPAPLADKSGNALHKVAGKRALVFPRVRGSHPETPTPDQCARIGDFLARAHLAGKDLGHKHPNPRGVHWLDNALRELDFHINTEDSVLLKAQASRYRDLLTQATDLPAGAIHGDLFRDNTLFLQDALEGVIDYFSACTDWLLLDLAIAVNDWCDGADGELDPHLTRPLLAAYDRMRPFSDTEIKHWRDILCVAATRFWTSRLLTQHAPAMAGSEQGWKDPAEYRQKLISRLAGCPPLSDKG